MPATSTTATADAPMAVHCLRVRDLDFRVFSGLDALPPSLGGMKGGGLGAARRGFSPTLSSDLSMSGRAARARSSMWKRWKEWMRSRRFSRARLRRMATAFSLMPRDSAISRELRSA